MKVKPDFFNRLREEIRESAAITDPEKSTDEIINEFCDRFDNGTPHVIDIMKGIQNGSISCSEVDWKKDVIGIIKLLDYIPTCLETTTWLWSLLCYVEDLSKRIEILNQIKAVAPKSYKDIFYASCLINDCDILIRLCRRAIDVNKNNRIKIRHTWNDNRKILNDIALVLNDNAVEPKDLVAIAELVHRTLQFGSPKGLLECILSYNSLIGEMSMMNIVEFVKNLYIAESLRRTINQGHLFYMDLPKLENFDRKLRKGCFDIYIESSLKRVERILDKDTTRVDDPDELECCQHLLQCEKELLASNDYLEAFVETPAYDALWYPGRDMIDDMIKSFIPYLEKRIAALQPERANMGNTIINVGHDYINGNKYVGTSIEKVSDDATGAIINPK